MWEHLSAQAEQKRMDAAQIAAQIESGDVIGSDITLSQPRDILAAIGQRAAAGELEGVTLHNILDVYPMPCYDPALSDRIKGISWFCSTQARKAANAGYGDVLPSYYRDFPRVARQTQVDVFIAAVSPMDKHGYFSLSTVGSVSQAYIETAKRIYVEVNDQLPRAVNAPQLHISQINGYCETSYALPVLPAAEPDEVSVTIGNIIAERIPDGATLQLGIGSIPDAVGMALKSKHHLGIHTEMFTDSMVELIECGAVDNSLKPIHRYRSVAAFAYGSQRIYDYIDDNPAFSLMPVDYVNEPAVIAQHPNFISVNAALEVDFYGQTCAESIGTRVVSGTGGHCDYVRGASMSPGGHSYIAFPSTAKHGTVSRIVPTLTPGSLVSTGKNDVDCIVTEYGVAEMRGKSLGQRAKALISIAHPNFRDELTEAARKQGILLD